MSRTCVAIPKWDVAGVLPPFDAVNPTSANRAPYPVAMTDLVLHFSTSDERRAILDGLLRYRGALYAAGLTDGFQWINGSFTENVEVLEKRAPRDIDVVTFFRLPAGKTQRDILGQHRPLFDRRQTKAAFNVDAYPVCIGGDAELLVERSTYWYSMWAHRRDRVWKGFLEVGLDGADDATARASLAAAAQGVAP